MRWGRRFSGREERSPIFTSGSEGLQSCSPALVSVSRHSLMHSNLRTDHPLKSAAGMMRLLFHIHRLVSLGH